MKELEALQRLVVLAEISKTDTIIINELETIIENALNKFELVNDVLNHLIKNMDALTLTLETLCSVIPQ